MSQKNSIFIDVRGLASPESSFRAVYTASARRPRPSLGIFYLFFLLTKLFFSIILLSKKERCNQLH